MSFDDLEHSSDMFTMGYEQALKDLEPKLSENAQLKEVLRELINKSYDIYVYTSTSTSSDYYEEFDIVRDKAKTLLKE